MIKTCIDWLKTIFAPVKILWDRDKTYIVIFVVVNLLIGQLGFLISIGISVSNGTEVAQALNINLVSGAFYIFSITLLVSCLAIIGSELIDALRHSTTGITTSIKYLDTKVIWCVLGLVIAVYQASMAGSLLSTNNQSKLNAEAEYNTETVSKNVKLTSVSKESSAFERSSLIPNAIKTNPARSIDYVQLTFWMLSMLISLELYCLYRIPLITDGYSLHRKQEVDDLIAQASKQTKTPFGENV